MKFSKAQVRNSETAQYVYTRSLISMHSSHAAFHKPAHRVSMRLMFKLVYGASGTMCFF